MIFQDRDGCRTPMQWLHSTKNAGFSTSDAPMLPLITDPVYGYEQVAVDLQQKTPNSLLNWMRRTIRKRKKFPVRVLFVSSGGVDGLPYRFLHAVFSKWS